MSWTPTDWASGQRDADFETEFNSAKASIPDDFDGDRFYYDKTLIKHYALPRRIFTTEWTAKRGLDGVDIRDVTLAKVVYDGLKNWTLRHLAHGKASYFIMAKTLSLSTLLYGLTQVLSESDIEHIALTWNKTITPGLPVVTDSEKREVILAYAKHIADSVIVCSKNSETTETSAFQRVKVLEAELATLKLQHVQIPVPGAAPANPLGPFAKHAGRPKILATDCPSSKLMKDVNSWSAKHVSKQKDREKGKAVADAKKLAVDHEADDDARLELLRVELVFWGMPIRLAADMSEDACLKVLATISMIP